MATDWNAVHKKLELVWYRELSADEGLDEIQDLINTTPPQRTWVGLTNPERSECWDTIPERAMKKVEAKLKEKNQ